MTFQLSLDTELATAAYPAGLLAISSEATVEEAVQLMQTQRASCLLVCDGLSADTPEGRAGSSPEGQAESSPDGHVGDGTGSDHGEPHAENTDCTLLGIYTERDALKWMAAGCQTDIPITAAMSDSPVALQESATVGEAIQKMAAGGYRHLPILAFDGSPASVATVQGIVHYLVELFPDTIYNLPPNPSSGPSEREGA